MRPLEITLRIHRNLAIPALELPKVSAQTELGAGAAEGLGLRARSAILVVSPSLAGAGPGAEPSIVMVLVTRILPVVIIAYALLTFFER